jgi:dienelactone hydrolase
LLSAGAALTVVVMTACTRPPTGGGPGPAPTTPPDTSGVPAAGTLPIDRPTPSGCITNVGPSNKMVISGCGQNITYNVSVPSQCLSKACGLIFDVHGLAMNGTNQDNNTGIAAIGRQEGYIVVNPNGPGSSWSAANDPAISAFMDLAIRVWKVEARRVHFTGYSMGGAMTLRMRCLKRDVLASAAPMSIGGSSGDAACAAPAPPMDTLYIQGTKDPLVRPESRQMVLDDFKRKYGLGEGQVIQQNPNFTWTRWTNASGFVFENIMHDYSDSIIQGHCFIGSLAPQSLFGCDQTAPIRHGRVVVDFFKAHPKRG